MPVVKSVELKWDNKKLGEMDQKAIEGLFKLATDIAKQARRNSPILTGALRNSIRIEKENDKSLVVIAGGMAVNVRLINYAWVREQSNRLHPEKAHYMEKAQKAIMTGNFMKQYFGKVTK